MSPPLPPDKNLRASVVVPARNEEELVGACLEALAKQEGIAHDEYEVILVLDSCTDATEHRARGVSAVYPHLQIHILDGPGKGAGHARRTGMEAACRRLLQLGKPSGLIASTDADTVVAPDWLAAQLKCADNGARAIGGRIELIDENTLPQDVTRWRHKQGMARHQDLLARDGEAFSSIMEHWQFSGASLALTAEAYEEIGGLEPLTALEDEYLERVLHQRGVQIERPLAVRVKTSARRNGRAERGLAQDLAVASWFHGNTYRASDFDVKRVLQAKEHTVSLILAGGEYSPATFSSLAGLRDSGVLDEIIQVNTLPATNGLPHSVEAYKAEELMPDFGPSRGYGDLLWRGISAVRGGLVLALDPEQSDCVVERVCGLLGPLMERDDLSMVKGFRSPPGILSELLAQPLINLHHPKLAGFAEPLCGDIAAHKQLLHTLHFPVGHGVDISLLLDAAEREGTGALAQTHVPGVLDRTFRNSSEIAYAILAAAARRTPDRTEKEPVPGPFFLPGPAELESRRIPVEERPPLNSVVSPSSRMPVR